MLRAARLDRTLPWFDAPDQDICDMAAQNETSTAHDREKRRPGVSYPPAPLDMDRRGERLRRIRGSSR
jgi:hypothetical protein